MTSGDLKGKGLYKSITYKLIKSGVILGPSDKY